jgi:2-octaprenylphenol hydroxylase
MGQKFDVLIVGGGIVGLSAALAMAQKNYTVAILDAKALKADLSKPDLRVYAINHASETLLNKLGAWQYLDMQRVSPYSGMYVWDGVTGAAIDFDSRLIAAQKLGSIIEESVLKQALLQHIQSQPGISLFADSPVDEVHTDLPGVKIYSQEKSWDGQLLMIADGAQSPTRQKLKVQVKTWPYRQEAIVASVRTEHSHQHTARQVFNPDGPLAFLPLAHDKQCSIVWSTDTSRARQLMALDDAAFNTALHSAFSGKLGEVEVISPRHSFPLHMRHVNQYAGADWLLLGDAAHTIHPLAGLGLNLGLADLSSWINCMDTMKNRSFSKKQLGAYQRERKNAVWQTIMLMEGFKRLFSHTAAPILSLRGLGLRACNNLSPLKRLFIQHASG